MIGLDTNLLVRYITQDDKVQASKATLLIEQQLSERNPGFVTLIVLVELTWVLESCYNQDKQAIIKILKALLSTKQLFIESSDIAHLALRDFEESQAGFSDAIIFRLCLDAGCHDVISFDKKAHTLGMKKP